jgi:hypothetical protein
MTDTSSTAPERIYKTGRRPILPEGERLAIGWLHDYDVEVAPGAQVLYPVAVGTSIADADWRMLGNGPEDPDDPVTVPMPAGDSGATGAGDCGFAGKDHHKRLAGYVAAANGTLTGYCAYEAATQGVPLGQEQDDGVVVADMLHYLLTHDELGNVVPLGQGDVELFAPVHPDTLGAVMAKYQRGIILGVNLTDQDQQTFPNWSESSTNPPDPNEGHVVYLVQLDGPIGSATGSGRPVSWGQRAHADAPWMTACPEEWWILLTSADRETMGAAAFDALAADVAAIPGWQGTVPTPAPVVTPPPAPSPAPPPPKPPTPAAAPNVIAWLESLGYTVTGPK